MKVSKFAKIGSCVLLCAFFMSMILMRVGNSFSGLTTQDLIWAFALMFIFIFVVPLLFLITFNSPEEGIGLSMKSYLVSLGIWAVFWSILFVAEKLVDKTMTMF